MLSPRARSESAVRAGPPRPPPPFPIPATPELTFPSDGRPRESTVRPTKIYGERVGTNHTGMPTPPDPVEPPTFRNSGATNESDSDDMRWSAHEPALTVNTTRLMDQDDYGEPSPVPSTPDDSRHSRVEYGTLVGPRRDLCSEDELESVAEEHESGSLLSDDDHPTREDRTAAMIIVDEGRGRIVNGADRPLSELDVQQGTTHLLLPQNTTPDRLLPFLSVMLPQICSSLLCLDLSSNNLGALPLALSSCTNLEELNISNNPLRALPQTLGALTSLRVLIADACDLQALPVQLAHLGALHSLSVRSNKLVMLPVWMHSMLALDVLKLDGNPFVGPWRALVEPLLSQPELNGVYASPQGANSYPILSESRSPPRAQVQRSYSQQPASASSPYLNSRPSTVHSQISYSPLSAGHSPLSYSPMPMHSPLHSPPPPLPSALNVHLGALAPRRKKRSSFEGDVTDLEVESATSSRDDPESERSPRKMKSADELRRMGFGGLGVELGESHPPPPPPPPENEEDMAGHVKRYASLGVRSREAKNTWAGQRNSAAASISSARYEPEEDKSKFKWTRGIFKRASKGRLRSHSNAEKLGRTPVLQLGDLPDVPRRPSAPSAVPVLSPPLPIVPPMPMPRVDVTSAGSPASSVLTAKLQHKNSREMLNPTPVRTKRRSFLPFDAPPALNIPIPSTELLPIAIQDDREEENRQAALREVLAYLRDMADLGAPGRMNGRRPVIGFDGRATSDGSFASSSSTPALRSAPSTTSLRGGQESVVTTDSSGSYGQGFAEDRKYKDDKGKRVGIIKEIVETEKSYVKGLQELVDIYVKPAAEPIPGIVTTDRDTIVPARERKKVFADVESLVQFHRQIFLPALQQAADLLQNGDDANGQISTAAAHAVATVFAKHAAFMRMYLPYINNFDAALARLQTWTTPPSAPGTPGSATPSGANAGISISIAVPEPPPQTSLNASQRKRIEKYLKRCKHHPRHSQLNLESYLLLPIQRIPRYRMLLDGLVTCTPPRPEASEDPLERALDEIAVLASSMNEGKRESEWRNRLVQWQGRIKGKFISPLVQPHRRLIKDGRLSLVRLVKMTDTKSSLTNPDGTLAQVEIPCLSLDTNRKQLVAILCNDLLVLCKEPAIPSEYVDLWAVLRMQTMAQPASIVSGNCLRIVDNKAILYFSMESTSEALTWQRAINLNIPHSQ